VGVSALPMSVPPVPDTVVVPPFVIPEEASTAKSCALPISGTLRTGGSPSAVAGRAKETATEVATMNPRVVRRDRDVSEVVMGNFVSTSPS